MRPPLASLSQILRPTNANPQLTQLCAPTNGSNYWKNGQRRTVIAICGGRTQQKQTWVCNNNLLNFCDAANRTDDFSRHYCSFLSSQEKLRAILSSAEARIYSSLFPRETLTGKVDEEASLLTSSVINCT